MNALEVLSILGGTALLLFAVVDVFMTVFMIGGGAGPQSRFAADRLWRLALRLHDVDSPRSHSLMRAVGPLIVLLALLTWVLELVLGWALVFVPSTFAEPGEIGIDDRIVFAGKVVVGRSGNTPSLEVAWDGWEMVLSLAGASGVVIISVGLAYVLPILAAVAHKRSIAATIHTLGDTVDDMRALGQVSGGSSFELHLVALVSGIVLCAERHRSYPVLHYFHSHDGHSALAPAVAKIALLLRADREGLDKVDPTVAEPLLQAIRNLVSALSTMGLTRYAREMEDPDTDAMSPIDIAPSARSARGGALPIEWFEAYVRFDGWSWDEIVAGDASRRR